MLPIKLSTNVCFTNFSRTNSVLFTTTKVISFILGKKIVKTIQIRGVKYYVCLQCRKRYKHYSSCHRHITHECVKSVIRCVDTQNHFLLPFPRNESGRQVRRRCFGCYRNMRKGFSVEAAARKTKQVGTACSSCKRAFCLTCFNEFH